MERENFKKAASYIENSGYTVVFTGAGISAESGIPPFRGPDGLWSQYDPAILNLRYFRKNPQQSWEMIRKIFFDRMKKAKPNVAHRAIALLEARGYVQSVVTQNIDNLHTKAGSRRVYEYHGALSRLCCTECYAKFPADHTVMEKLPPRCPDCRGILRPDIVFFDEPIPDEINRVSFGEAEYAETLIIVGTSGTIKPASLIPYTAKRSRAQIVEINIGETPYTSQITDIFLRGKATDVLSRLAQTIIDKQR